MRICFLSVANAARGQMAEGLARHRAPGGITVTSAGSAPTAVRPEAIAVLAEKGIDIRDQHSKGVDEVHLPSMDLVIILCEDEVSPTLPAETTQRQWPFPDPATGGLEPEESLAAFRTVRDDIDTKIRKLFADLRPI